MEWERVFQGVSEYERGREEGREGGREGERDNSGRREREGGSIVFTSQKSQHLKFACKCFNNVETGH